MTTFVGTERFPARSLVQALSVTVPSSSELRFIVVATLARPSALALAGAAGGTRVS